MLRKADTRSLKEVGGLPEELLGLVNWNKRDQKDMEYGRGVNVWINIAKEVNPCQVKLTTFKSLSIYKLR